jgi:hypothetical protein
LVRAALDLVEHRFRETLALCYLLLRSGLGRLGAGSGQFQLLAGVRDPIGVGDVEPNRHEAGSVTVATSRTAV